MKKHNYVLFLVVYSTIVLGQRPEIHYVNFFNNTGSTQSGVLAMQEDSQGNLYHVGFFEDELDLDPGLGTYMVDLDTVSFVDRAGFLVKTDPNGNFKWARVFYSKVTGGGTNGNEASVSKLVIDDFDNIYIGGTYQVALNLNNNISQNQLNHNTNGSNNSYVAKFDTAGNYQWARNVHGDGNITASSIAVDKFGGVCVSYLTSGTVRISRGNGTKELLTVGSEDALIVKWDNSGMMEWNRLLYGNGNHEVLGMGLDDSLSLYFTATYNAQISYLNNHLNTVASGARDILVGKLDTSGALVWHFSLSDSHNKLLRQAAIDPLRRRFYIGGEYRDSIDFDPSQSTYRLPNYLPNFVGLNRNVFLASYGFDGSFKWAKSTNGYTGGCISYSISIDHSNGDVYHASSFNTYPTVYNMSNDTLESNRGTALLSYKEDGTFKGVYEFDDLRSLPVLRAQSGYYYSSYRFGQDVVIDPWNPASTITYPIGKAASTFVIKYDFCDPVWDTITGEACDVVSFEGISYFSDTLFVDTTYRVGGCDSIRLIDFTINTIDDGIVYINNALTSVDSSYISYQWFDCNTGFADPQDTLPYLFPRQNGRYAVSVDDGFCTDTSRCFNITNVSISENELSSGIQVYPNPTSQLLSVDLEKDIEFIKLEILDASGRQLIVQEQLGPVDLGDLSNGIYWVRILTDSGEASKQIIKE